MKATIFVLILVAIGIGAVKVNLSKQDVNSTTQNAGRQTKEERVRSVYRGTGANRNLRDLAARATEDINVRVGPGLLVLSPTQTVFNLSRFLENMSCHADAVIVGEVTSSTAQLTEDESFVFTNYEMTVEEVIKNNPVSSLQIGSNITVARTGGRLRLGRRNIRASVHGFLPLETDKRYLLFLQFVPERASYIAHESKGSFLINGNAITKLTEDQLPSEIESGNDARAFIEAIRLAVSSPCEGKGTQ